MLEQKLKSIETLLVSSQKYETYQTQLETIWKEILLYQFHDILPGSSIKRVYDECLERYDKLNQELEDLLKQAFLDYSDVYQPGSLRFNPLFSDTTIKTKVNGKYYIDTISRLSTRVINKIEFEEQDFLFEGIIETNLLKVEFNQKNGQITSIIDKEQERSYYHVNQVTN